MSEKIKVTQIIKKSKNSEFPIKTELSKKTEASE